jgi:hypothetical protein
MKNLITFKRHGKVTASRLPPKFFARALNRDMSVSQTSWHKEVILGRNIVFRVFLL